MKLMTLLMAPTIVFLALVFWHMAVGTEGKK